MRRKDREVLGDENIAKIIEQCTTCHVALMDDDNASMPYVIPLSFGYSLNSGVLELYFHCAHVGKKLDCIRKNPNVAFSMCVENRIEIHEDVYCKSGRFYASVVGHGKAEIVEECLFAIYWPDVTSHICASLEIFTRFLRENPS